MYDVDTFSFISQGVFLVLLIYGYYLIKRKKYKQHGRVFLSLTILHFLSLFIVMIPAFFKSADLYFNNFLESEYAISVLHIIIGTGTEVIAVIVNIIG